MPKINYVRNSPGTTLTSIWCQLEETSKRNFQAKNSYPLPPRSRTHKHARKTGILSSKAGARNPACTTTNINSDLSSLEPLLSRARSVRKKININGPQKTPTLISSTPISSKVKTEPKRACPERLRQKTGTKPKIRQLLLFVV